MNEHVDCYLKAICAAALLCCCTLHEREQHMASFLAVHPDGSNNFLDEGMISKFLEWETTNVMLAHQGKVIFSWHATGNDEYVDTMSMTKSVISVIFASMLQENFLVSLDEPLCQYYPQWNTPSHRRITIAHVLDQVSGLEPLTTDFIYSEKDFIKLALEARVIHEPGTYWEYNNRIVNLLPDLIQKITGISAKEYLEKYILNENKQNGIVWLTDDVGHFHGMAGLYLNSKNLLEIAQLIITNKNQRRSYVLSSQWLDPLLKPRLDHQFYRLLWWKGLNGYIPQEYVKQAESLIWAQGFGGQYLFVVPFSETIIMHQRNLEQANKEEDIEIYRNILKMCLNISSVDRNL